MRNLAVLTLLLSHVAYANVLQVGAGKTYATPCAAIGAANANDEVDIAPGTYTDSCEINQDGLIVKGVGGRPKIDLSGTNHPADYKGIYVVNGANVRIENLELTGANVPVDTMYGGNGAGIRVVGNGLIVHGCYIHDNQDGILGTPADSNGSITIEYTELARNGMGDACNVTTCTHNVYIGNYGHLVFQYNWTHQVANDTPDKGHLLKSRALRSDILYNRITGETGLDSYEVNLPNGGLSIVVGNVVEKGVNAGNSYLLRYGEEGLSNADKRLFVAANTFVNDKASGSFIDVAAGGTLTAHDNVFAGTGTVSNTGTLSADNLSAVDPLFVDRAGYDYHLMNGSPAIGIAVDPGSADTTSLSPAFEYVQPTSAGVRASHLDVGAFEHGTPPTALDSGAILVDMGGDAPLDAAIPSLTDGGVSSSGDAAVGGETPTSSSDDKGCSYAVGGASHGALALGLILLAFALARRRAGA